MFLSLSYSVKFVSLYLLIINNKYDCLRVPQQQTGYLTGSLKLCSTCVPFSVLHYPPIEQQKPNQTYSQTSDVQIFITACPFSKHCDYHYLSRCRGLECSARQLGGLAGLTSALPWLRSTDRVRRVGRDLLADQSSETLINPFRLFSALNLCKTANGCTNLSDQ